MKFARMKVSPSLSSATHGASRPPLLAFDLQSQHRECEGEAAEAAEVEAGGCAGEGNHDATRRGRNDPRALPDHRIERYRLHQVFLVDELGEDRLASRVVEGLHRAADEGDREDVPDPYEPGRIEGREAEDGRGHRELGRGDDLALVYPIGENATDEVQQDGRQSRKQAGEAEIELRAGQLVDEPTLRHPHHLLGADGSEVAEPVASVLRVAQDRPHLEQPGQKGFDPCLPRLHARLPGEPATPILPAQSSPQGAFR